VASAILNGRTLSYRTSVRSTSTSHSSDTCYAPHSTANSAIERGALPYVCSLSTQGCRTFPSQRIATRRGNIREADCASESVAVGRLHGESVR
jgi:hypothetical protein